MKANRDKTFILGIDGATFDIILPLAEKGKLPNIQRIMQNGAYGTLNSTIPSLSPPAWVAFMTGSDPGHTGIYHFRKINIEKYQNTYNIDLINSSAYSGTTFFDYLGRLGYKVGVMTVPVTYPTWAVNGFMVAGYPCPDPHDNPNCTYPQGLSEQLTENLNWTEVKGSTQVSDGELRDTSVPDSVLEGGLAMMSRRTDYTLKLMKQFECDLTILVWGAIDRAQHKLWKYHDSAHILHKPNNQFKTYIERLYCHADFLLGKIIEEIGQQTRLFIVSDHGFGPKQGCFFHTNAWLNELGYLKTGLRSKIFNNIFVNAVRAPLTKFIADQAAGTRRKMREAKDTLKMGSIRFDRTRAYRFPLDEQTEGVVINLKGRQDSGCVSEEEYEQLRFELITNLKKIRDPRNGYPIVKNCYRREDIYSGKKCSEAPDIIFTLQEGYYSGARISGALISEIPGVHLETISGHHKFEGIFIAHGPDIRQGKLDDGMTIMDVASTVLYALGERIPSNMTGYPALSIFDPERVKKNPPEYIDTTLSDKIQTATLASSEEETMKNQLKDLGYL